MSSRSTQIIGGPSREHAWVESATNALRVYLVNGSGGGGGTEFNRDSAAGATDAGTQVLAVRDDSGGTLVSADGDYTPLSVNASGELRVTGGGGGTQYEEDDAHTTGDTGTVALVVRNDTPGTLADTDGDYAVLQVDSTGRLRTAVDASVALEVGTWSAGTLNVDIVGQTVGDLTIADGGNSITVDDGGSSLTVDGTVAATQSGTWNVGTVTAVTDITNVVSVDDNGGSLTVDGSVSVSNFPASQTVDGTVTVVDGGGSLTVDGTVAVSGKVNVDLTDVSAGTLTVTSGTEYAEDSPHSSTDPGQFMMAVRVDADASPLAGSNLDYHPLMTDSVGRLRCVIVQGDASAQNSTVRVRDYNNASKGMNIVQNGDAESTLAELLGPVPFFVSGTEEVFAGLVTEGDMSWGTTDTTAALRVVCVEGAGEGAIHLEDSAHANGDGGMFALTVRRDTAASTAGTDGDYAAFTTDSTGRLHVNVGNSVTVAQATHANLLTQGRIQDGDGSTLLDVVGAGDTSPTYSTVNGLVPLAWFQASEPEPTEDGWNPLYMNEDGALSVVADVQSVLPGTGVTALGKAEDAAHTSGATGVMALGVVKTTPAGTSSTADDYAAFTLSSDGAIWVRNVVRMEALSESTDGQPIQISATSTAGDDLHISTANQTDRVTIDLTNTSDSPVEVTLEFGGTGTGNLIITTVPPNDTVRAVSNAAIGGSASTRTIAAFAGTTNVINAIGYVERNV